MSKDNDNNISKLTDKSDKNARERLREEKRKINRTKYLGISLMEFLKENNMRHIGRVLRLLQIPKEKSPQPIYSSLSLDIPGEFQESVGNVLTQILAQGFSKVPRRDNPETQVFITPRGLILRKTTLPIDPNYTNYEFFYVPETPGIQSVGETNTQKMSNLPTIEFYTFSDPNTANAGKFVSRLVFSPVRSGDQPATILPFPTPSNPKK